MIEDKIIETSIDLFEPNEIYTTNLRDLLLEKLTKRYKNICFSSMLITEIVEIIRYSERYMVDNRLDGGCYVNVQFKARGVVLHKGSVLHGCKVIKITNSNVIVDHKYATGMMVADAKKRVFGLISKDQIVPVVITNVRYNVGKPQISIICTPFTPTTIRQIYYNVNQAMTPEDTDKIDSLLEEYNKELELHKKMETSKSYQFFKDLIYPYKTKQKFTVGVIGSKFTPIKLDIKSILSIKNGYITLPEVSDDIYYSKEKIPSESIYIIDSPYYSALSELMLMKLNHLTMLRGFAEQYDTAEKVKEMLAYWKMCTTLKE